jgi:short-subunit dehydrogenase
MIVNNAGIDVVCRFEELIDLELFKRVMDVNLYGAVHCTYHALPYLKASKGRIVNISSMAGLIAIPLNTSYVASKFAMNGFSDSLRMELGKTGVSVTVICPYWVVSEFHENYLDKYGKRKGRSGRAIYTRKMMSADQCARIVIEAACKRKREVLLGPGRLAALMKVAAPGWVDRITIRAVLRPLERRMNKGKKGEGR